MPASLSLEYTQRALADSLARRIFCGVWPAGGRLPTVRELMVEFGVASMTVRRGLGRLKAAGLIEATVGRGTFVADPIPNADRAALLVPDPAGKSVATSLFYEALQRAARQLPGWQVEPWRWDWGGQLTGAGGDLWEQVLAYRYGGLVYANNPYQLAGTPLLGSTLVPRVAVMSDVNPRYPDCAAVYPDRPSFFRRALRRLAEVGCRRPGLITHSEYDVGVVEHLLAEMNGAFEHEPWWFQSVPWSARQMAANAALALLNPHQARRPDALIVIDDHLVNAVEAGIREAGLEVPGQLRLVVWCNFPAKVGNLPHVDYLGFDAREVLAACRQQLRRRQSNREPTELTLIPARFEEELSPACNPSPPSTTVAPVAG